MNHTLKTMLIAASAIASVTASAQDKATLDLLVKKGIITPEERAKTLEQSASAKLASGQDRVFIKEEGATRLTFSGRIQGQWEAAAYSQTTGGVTTEAFDLNNFLMRRLYLGAKADVGQGFSGEIVWDFGANSNTSTGTVRAGAADKAVFTSESQFGKFDIGYQKVQFGQEENTSSSALYTVERSMVTRYWAESHNGRRLGFGARHVGLHNSNKVAVGEGGPGTFAYGASIVDAIQGYNTTGVNDYGYYANASFDWKPLGLMVGVNYGIAPQGGTLSAVNGDMDMVEGWNPYLKYVTGNLTLVAEYIVTDVDASSTTIASSGFQDRSPNGYNLTLAYKFSEQLQGVVRYSLLDTDGRGQQVGDGFRDVQTTGLTAATYDESNSIFIGLNYYFNKMNAKIQAGYEKAKLEGRITGYDAVTGAALVVDGDYADADIFRIQAQVLF